MSNSNSASEWELVDFNQMAPEISKNSSEWELVPPEEEKFNNKESLLSSLMQAPYRIGSDIGQNLYGIAKNIPNYYESAKTEVPGLGKTALEMMFPLLNQNEDRTESMGKQALAGSQELINKLAQFPLNVSRYGSERLHLLPEGITSAISKITPEDTTESINQLFGEPKYPGEALARGAIRNIPELIGINKLTSFVNPSKLLGSEKSISKVITNTHDALDKKASEGFKKVSKEYKVRNLPDVNIQPDILENISDYFPKTKQSEKLIKNAKTGNYDSLRKLQSDLYTNGKKNINSPLETDRMKGAEMFEKREEINQSISDHLKNLGQDDLNDILNQSRNDYRTLQEIYYNPNLNSSIINLVNEDVRKMPNNLAEILNEESKPMQKLREFHPGLQNQIRHYLLKKQLSSLGLKYGLPAAGAAFGGYEALKYAYPRKGE